MMKYLQNLKIAKSYEQGNVSTRLPVAGSDCQLVTFNLHQRRGVVNLIKSVACVFGGASSGYMTKCTTNKTIICSINHASDRSSSP